MKTILKIAHRGAKGYEPENTLASFQKALDMQVDGIELDVHLSSDGHLVVLHDETIDKTTNGKGLVNSFSLQKLKSFRIENEHQIPTLAEVFDLVNQQCFINIELKSFESADAVVALIEFYVSEKNWNYTSFLVSSFDWNALQQLAFLNNQIPIGVLAELNLDLAQAFAKFIQARSIHPHFHLLTKDNTAQLQQKGFEVFPWTINEEEDIQKIKTFNVNGIITDFPNRI
jgi:glycerophosphoryl diester phosphodiesterase